MASATTAAPGFGIPPYPVRKLSVDDYHALIRQGTFAEDEAVELIEGWLVPQMSRNPPHEVCLDQLQELIRGLVPPGWRVRLQMAVTLPDSEPEPDVAVVPGPASRYLAGHPGPADIALLVEVSDASLAFDRGDKARVYARAGITEYWVVNIPDRRVEVYTQPSGPTVAPAYGHRQDYDDTSAVPLVIAGQAVGTVAVAAVLP
jgi:Uma2 family endonuclease